MMIQYIIQSACLYYPGHCIAHAIWHNHRHYSTGPCDMELPPFKKKKTTFYILVLNIILISS